jgi:TonB family protein
LGFPDETYSVIWRDNSAIRFIKDDHDPAHVHLFQRGSGRRCLSPYPDVYELGGDVIPPKARSRVEPVYTQVARNAGVEGTVLLHAIVTKEGKTRIMRIVRPVGYGLEESAAEALSRWTFQPGTLMGQPVNVSLFIEVNFNVKD